MPAALVAFAVLLAAARAAADPCGCGKQARDAAGEDNDPAALGFGLTVNALVGTRWMDVGKLSALIARYGYAPLPSMAVQSGGGFSVTGGRVRFDLEVTGGDPSTWRPRGGQTLPAQNIDVAFLLGYAVVHGDGGSAIVSTGFAGGNLELDTRGKGLDGLWKLHDDEGGVLRSYTGLPLQLELQRDFRLATSGGAAWLLRLGVRATWFQQLHGDWVAYSNTDGKGPRDISGPSVDLSGPSLLLSLGFGAAAVSSE